MYVVQCTQCTMCSRVFGREQLLHPKGVTPGFAKKPGLTGLSWIISRRDAAFKLNVYNYSF